MKKFYPLFAGLTLASLGSLLTGTVAQQIANRSAVANQPSVQTTTNPVPSCPLAADIAVTFLNSQCRAVVLKEPKTYYRYYSTDSNRFGRYLTANRYDRNTDVIRNLALNQAWGNQATMMLTVTVPAGTTVYEGIVAPQNPQSCYVGGGQQTFIEDTRDPKLVWSVGTPMKQVEPFQCS